MEPFQLVKPENVSSPQRFRLQVWEDQFDWLSVGFTGRENGVSKSPYTSLNCALHVGDEVADVVENRRRVAEEAGFSLHAWTCAEQVHGHGVSLIQAHDRGKGSVSQEQAVPHTDGLITAEENVLLAALYADCVPLYFLDPAHRIVALAHAGWKGTVQRIAFQVIQLMNERLGSKVSEIRVAIGPSIGRCCYEVDDRVMDHVKKLMPEKSFHDHSGQGHYMLDLKQINRKIMLEAGILSDHIEVSKWCTHCHPEYFFSHRRDGMPSGRMASWIGIKARRDASKEGGLSV